MVLAVELVMVVFVVVKPSCSLAYNSTLKFGRGWKMILKAGLCTCAV